MKLSIIDYMAYLGGTNTSRCVYEGEEVLNAGHLIMCGKLDSASNSRNVLVCGLCLQTSNLKADPHEIKGQLEIVHQKIKVKNMNCTCKAGNGGKCKHISALLIKCTRVDVESLEVISQTQLKCTWSKQKTLTEDKYHAVPISKMPCLKTDLNNEFRLVHDENKMYDFFIQKLPSSAISKHKVGRRQVPDHTVNFVNNFKDQEYYIVNILNNAAQSPLMMELYSFQIQFNGECCKRVYNELFEENEEPISMAIQQSQIWHDKRKFRVTGSRVYSLYTYAGKDFENKSIKYFYPKKFTKKYIKHGIKYEAEARDVFREKTGFITIECGLIISHSNPWLGYSPDGIIIDDNGRPAALIEIKCLYNGSIATIMEALPKATFLIKNNDNYEMKKKHQYYGQIQLGMALLNLPKCYVVIYASFDKSLKVIEVEFDYQFTNVMLSTVKRKFIKKMIHTLCNKM